MKSHVRCHDDQVVNVSWKPIDCSNESIENGRATSIASGLDSGQAVLTERSALGDT